MRGHNKCSWTAWSLEGDGAYPLLLLDNDQFGEHDPIGDATCVLTSEPDAAKCGGFEGSGIKAVSLTLL